MFFIYFRQLVFAHWYQDWYSCWADRGFDRHLYTYASRLLELPISARNEANWSLRALKP